MTAPGLYPPGAVGVNPLEGGGSAVSVDSEINLVGKIVQFGRGMIEEVSRQMFRQFATCVKSRLKGDALVLGREGVTRGWMIV